MKCVIVDWEDSWADVESSWTSEEVLCADIKRPMIVHSCGFLYKDTKRAVVLIGGHNKRKPGVKNVINVFTIPKKCIIRMKTFDWSGSDK